MGSKVQVCNMGTGIKEKIVLKKTRRKIMQNMFLLTFEK